VTPDVLIRLAEEIAEEPRFDTEGAWVTWDGGMWSLPVLARLSVPETKFMPEESLWHLLVNGSYVFIHPDAEFGVKATFRHQDPNGAPECGRPWRTGKPCLELPVASLGRFGWDEEPRRLEERVRWKMRRLLDWIDGAAAGTLATAGDPLELPAGMGQDSLVTFGFAERREDLAWWAASEGRWGFLSTSRLLGTENVSAIRSFAGPNGKPVRDVTWPRFVSHGKAEISGVWIRLDTLPVMLPWRAPATWAELGGLLAEQGVDLAELLVQAGACYRRSSRPTREHVIFLGFPLEARIGEPAERMHWLATALHLTGRSERLRKGKTDEWARRTNDRRLAASPTPLRWLRTQNWASDQLRARGEAELELRAMRVLVVGCGALGGHGAENLARLGVAHITVMDGQRMDMGNLSRHALDMSSVGRFKAQALAWELSSTLPDVRADAIVGAFPPTDSDLTDRVRDHDLVVDCTASDEVLDAMANFAWVTEKLFISLSISWGADGLFAYGASEASFPAEDAKARFAGMRPPDVELAEARPEAIGCWTPVFPATADDMSLWAATGTAFIRRMSVVRGARCDIYRRLPDGSVERSDG
jgi:predicted ThiF/HesA family dinucleotide-utilizing enzyme